MIAWSIERVLIVEEERIGLNLFRRLKQRLAGDRGLTVGRNVGKLIGAGFLFLPFGAFGSCSLYWTILATHLSEGSS